MTRVLSNALRLAKSPRLAYRYALWLSSKMWLRRLPIARPYPGVAFGEWVNFSEYSKRYRGVPHDERELMLRCLGQSASPKIALDVGGNLGLFSLTLASLGFDRVDTFEPIPATFQRLRANVALNPELSRKIHLNMIGVGSEPGTIAFNINSFSPGTSKIADALDVRGSTAENQVLPITTLDQYCMDHQITEVAFLKVDVEGFELAVLRGAGRMLSTHAIKAVYLEVIDEALTNAGTSSEELFAYLAAFNYLPFQTTSEQPSQLLTAQDIADRAASHRNVLWLPVTDPQASTKVGAASEN